MNNTEIKEAHIEKAEVIISHEGAVHNVGEELKVNFINYTTIPIESAAISYQIINSRGVAVMHILNLAEEIEFCKSIGKYNFSSINKNCQLYPDNYSIIIHFADRKLNVKFESISEICFFQVKKLGELREYYWHSCNATYIEDNKWEINKLA